MNFVVWPDCADKRSRSVHTLYTVNNLMHNAMHLCANTTPGFAGCHTACEQQEIRLGLKARSDDDADCEFGVKLHPPYLLPLHCIEYMPVLHILNSHSILTKTPASQKLKSCRAIRLLPCMHHCASTSPKLRRIACMCMLSLIIHLQLTVN